MKAEEKLQMWAKGEGNMALSLGEIHNDVPPTLAGVVDVVTLQEIQDNFASATGLAIAIVNPDGSPLAMTAGVPGFCKMIHAHAGMPQRCLLPSVIARLDPGRGDSPFCFRCCSELQCIVAPIIVENRLLGAVQCSHIRAGAWGPSDSGFSDSEGLVEVIPSDRLYGAARSLQLLARHVTELGLMALEERRQKERNAALAAEAKARAELERALRDAELKLLRAQMDPHFLFNTLNTVAELAVMGKADEAAEVTYALASLLRASLSKGDKLVTLREEIGWLKDYLAIQHARFKDRLHFTLNVEDDAWDVLVPFMTLQPVVENAIVHGFGQMAKTGEIEIRVAVRECQVHISVRDNGRGMEGFRLAEVLDNLRNDKPGSEGLGLSNLERRLRYHFGRDFRMWIDSSVNVGTVVKIVFPDARGTHRAQYTGR